MASVTPTTPSDGPRCPPVRETTSIIVSRISAARVGSCDAGTRLRSSGPPISASSPTPTSLEPGAPPLAAKRSLDQLHLPRGLRQPPALPVVGAEGRLHHLR